MDASFITFKAESISVLESEKTLLLLTVIISDSIYPSTIFVGV
jgi:hypothetical protein